jgi:hypothetical protein
VEPEALLKSKRGISNEPRNVAIYLTRLIRGAGLVEICREYHLNKYSSASSVVARVRDRIAKDRQLRRRVEKRGVMLTKSQTVTRFLYGTFCSAPCTHTGVTFAAGEPLVY